MFKLVKSVQLVVLSPGVLYAFWRLLLKLPARVLIYTPKFPPQRIENANYQQYQTFVIPGS
jgi:hypothetical protein